MSAVISRPISDALFERQMRNLSLSLGDLCHYGAWHKADPTKPLIEMIRDMTRAREEYDEAAGKRAEADWAWEEEEERRQKEERKAQIPCAHCAKVQRHATCDVCSTTLRRYDALGCENCDASYKGCMTADWDSPCVMCDPRYIVDFRAAEEEQARANAAANDAAAIAPGVPSSSDDEDMGWYNSKKTEWAAYAAELDDESKESVEEEY
jgi:hypothetical protein